jgi:hypothetical protein
LIPTSINTLHLGKELAMQDFVKSGFEGELAIGIVDAVVIVLLVDCVELGETPWDARELAA